ncbi:MAG: M42 family metallopeptidase [Alicyclobacillus sp.]|nr:M42 family metallopeptidase [Alicyclobacillus sp.]
MLLSSEELLRQLTEATGPSGQEDEVRNLLRSQVSESVERCYTDVLGNLFCEQGSGQPGPRVLLDAHMDEVALMVVHAEDNGLLRFRAIGGIDPRVLVAKPVYVGAGRLPGVIGAKPVHLQSAAERRKPLPLDQLYIDIGARSKDDALAHVQLGDAAVFATRFGPLGVGCVKAKALDNRAGCAVLCEILRTPAETPRIGVFTVQEEVGLRGAAVAAYRVAPDLAITLETTVCADVADVPAHGQGTVLGAGPALTVQDGQTLADQRFLAFAVRTAERHQIPYQFRRVKGGTNNFAAIQRSRAGVVGGSVSIPVRYLHAPVQVMSLQDYHNTIRLVQAMLRELAQGGWPL